MATIESALTYVLALFLIAFSAFIEHTSVIMSVGGVILLCLRLYTDGVKAIDVFRRRDR